MSLDEKRDVLPSTNNPVIQPPPPTTRVQKVKEHLRTRPNFVLFFYAWVLFSLLYDIHRDLRSLTEWLGSSNEPRCPQQDSLTPENNAELWKSLNTNISTEEFKGKAIEWLAGAVRVRTESFDRMNPVGVDPRWDAFGPFHEYLLGAFPLVHTTLKLTKVNTYGLFYEWIGSDASLKPIQLAAHQDVVPVEPTTVDQWKHGPYSGYFDGKNIWGRGSSDDKSGLIGILSAVETLIAGGFQPTRTVILTFGFDEEASGFQGAGHLGPYLEKVYGENGIAMIVDEGSGFLEAYGSIVATPAIGEKGYIDVEVKVTSPGGHSSIPPEHTSIGILSALLVHYEQHPTEIEITRGEPIYATLQCAAEHSKGMDSSFRKLLKKSTYSKAALHKLQHVIRKDKMLSSMVRTTQAVDIIHGGVKSNALPEQAWAIVNHRIAVVSSVADLQARDTKLLESLAHKFNLTYEAFGSTISEEGAPASGKLSLSDPAGVALEPAPITPTGAGDEAAPYHLLSGTIKATYNAHREIQSGEDSVIVAPSIMSGNTDTRYYWKLSKHIFRYNHQNAGKQDDKNGLGGIHTVNEFLEVDAFVEMIRFFTTLILNADEARSF